jgi:hypothetical protein
MGVKTAWLSEITKILWKQAMRNRGMTCNQSCSKRAGTWVRVVTAKHVCIDRESGTYSTVLRRIQAL